MADSIKVNLIDSKGNAQYGLNWGNRENRNPNQAYIQLPPDVYKSDFFPIKGKYFVVKTDDGQTIIMTRAQKTEDGTALQTPEDNSLLGRYLRHRLGLEDGALITAEDIIHYGRKDVVFTKIDDMNYELDFSNEQKTNSVISNERPLQLIYYGAPGTGKSYTIDQVTNEDNSVRTTFHPDSDYAGFVGAYKPTMESVPMSAFVGKEVHIAQPQGNHTGIERKIVYKYVPQAFLKAYVEAWKRYAAGEDNPYYLVIEEINRGNCAQIFGDLFQLLDRNSLGCSSYAISADEDIAQFLGEDEKGFGNLSEEQKKSIRNFVFKKDSGAEERIGDAILNGSKLLLPPNLRIWATMNTSDQSLFPIDSAFKRRWNWEYIPIDTNPKDKNTGKLLDWKFKAAGKTYSWGAFLDFINPKILSLTLSEDKQMGYFFAKPDKKGSDGNHDTISEKVFVNKVLFYLWTDVFKDYDLTEAPFVYEENNVRKAYRFRDFFSTKGEEMLAKFVAGFNLPIVGEQAEDKDVAFDSDGDADLNDNKNENTRDYSKYSVNGIGNYSKSDAVVEVMKALVASNPEATANEIIEKVKSFNLSYTLVYPEADYKDYLDRSTDSRFAKRYARIELSDGESIYVYRGSTPARIGELINGLNNSGSGISLSKVE